MFLTESKNLVLVGINFKNTPIEVRGKFAMPVDKIKSNLANLQNKTNSKFFILSTCNRTEIYSTNYSPEKLIELWASFLNLKTDDISQYVFIKKGEEVSEHLFLVTSGLDSKILGDHEIVGQIKDSFNLYKSYGLTDGFMEKLVNSAVHSSREIKKKTSLSDGTTSVSYAVIKLMSKLQSQGKSFKICLVGLGNIGISTLKNIKTYQPEHEVVVVNRTEEHAMMLAEKYRVGWSPFHCQRHVLKDSDILIVATSLEKAFISKEDIKNTSIKYIFDLSVPCNVDSNVSEISGVKLYNVDDISDFINQTIKQRENSVPIAQSIVSEYLRKFKIWEHRRRYCRPKTVRNTCPAEIFSYKTVSC
jgi:glutamyl-tRNA reductase